MTPLDRTTQIRLFRQMLRIRCVEERIAAAYPAQEMRCPVHLCIGQEAVAAGVCEALADGDLVLSGHRSHGHYLARGGDLRRMVAELFGRATGCSRGRGGSMHLIDRAVGFLGATPIVGSTIPIAVGTALAAAMRGAPRITVVFFGEAATEEGVFHESLNFAALKRLPVLFVCENNLYSVYSALGVRQPPERDLLRLAAGHGIEGRRGDGNDVTEVYRLSAVAVARAREGAGPALLEFMTYRWREHCGPNYDNDLGYRSEVEFLEWRDRCPIASFRRRLLSEGVVTEPEIETLTAALQIEIDEAFEFARTSPFPDPAGLFDDVYARQPTSRSLLEIHAADTHVR